MQSDILDFVNSGPLKNLILDSENQVVDLLRHQFATMKEKEALAESIARAIGDKLNESGETSKKVTKAVKKSADKLAGQVIKIIKKMNKKKKRAEKQAAKKKTSVPVPITGAQIPVLIKE